MDGGAGLSRRALFRDIQAQIREYILQNDLKPGDMLPPAGVIAAKLGVSAGSLREALRAFEAIGVLETKHGVGTFVRAYDVTPILENLSYSLLLERQSLGDLVQAREALEIGLLADTIPCLSAEDLAEMEAIVARMAGPASTAEDDRQFHRTLYRCLHNEVVNQLLDIFWLVYHDLAARLDMAPPPVGRRYRQHAPILQAIRAGDAARAAATMREHFAGLGPALAKAAAAAEEVST